MAKDNKVAVYVEGGKTRTGVLTQRELRSLAGQGRLKGIRRQRDRMDHIEPGGTVVSRCY